MFSEIKLGDMQFNHLLSGQYFQETDVAEMANFLQHNFEMWKKNGCILLADNKQLDEFKTKFNVEKLVHLFDEVVA